MGGKEERKDPKDEFTVDYLGSCVRLARTNDLGANWILIRIKLMSPFRIDACQTKNPESPSATPKEYQSKIPSLKEMTSSLVGC